jgi:hypothetical protein
MKMLLGNFESQGGKDDIFKPTTGNESLHEISNDDEVRAVNSAASKSIVVKSTIQCSHN